MYSFFSNIAVELQTHFLQSRRCWQIRLMQQHLFFFSVYVMSASRVLFSRGATISVRYDCCRRRHRRLSGAIPFLAIPFFEQSDIKCVGRSKRLRAFAVDLAMKSAEHDGGRFESYVRLVCFAFCFWVACSVGTRTKI